MIKVTHQNTKTWHRISDVYGHGELLATSYDADNYPINLLITGKCRQLYTLSGKIVDITDFNGLKRTFVYTKVGDETFGKMILPKVHIPEYNPLVLAAEWVTKDLIPKFVELVINPNHKDSLIKVVERTSDMDILTTHNIAKVRAEKFDDILGIFIPRKIIMTTEGNQEIISESISDNKHYANIFNITEGQPGMSNLRVLV